MIIEHLFFKDINENNTSIPNWNKYTHTDIVGLRYQIFNIDEGTSCSWSHGSWIDSFLCNPSLTLIKLWVRIPLMARCIQYNIMLCVCQWLGAGRLFSLVSSINKTHHHDIIEILLKVALKHNNTNLLNIKSSECLN